MENCRVLYACNASLQNDSVLITISCNEDSDHQRIIKQKKYVGTQRKKLAGDTAKYGINLMISNNTISNLLNSEQNPFNQACINAQVLKKIKKEYRCENKLSSNIFYNSEAAKLMCNQFCLNGKISGYIQEISKNPF